MRLLRCVRSKNHRRSTHAAFNQSSQGICDAVLELIRDVILPFEYILRFLVSLHRYKWFVLTSYVYPFVTRAGSHITLFAGGGGFGMFFFLPLYTSSINSVF